MKVAVVIAAYNECENIVPLTQRLIATLDSLPDTSWKLIYVIEGNDGTVDRAREFAAARPEIEVHYNPEPLGLGRAFRLGFAAVPSDTDYVVTMDADMNHQPEEISALLAAAQRLEADIVVGSRRLEQSREEGIPAWKNALSRTVNRAMHFTTGLRVNDLTSGFRVYRGQALRQIEIDNTGFAFLPEILIKANAQGLRIVEQPIHFVFRKAGESKLRIVTTSVSYLRLFARHSVSVTAWLTLAVFLVGLGFWIAFCFPAHKYIGDSDAILSGLCALDIKQGAHPLFFPGGYRLSSQTCYVTAAMYHVFGLNRLALGATAVLYGALFLLFGWLALREAGGRKAAVLGLALLALPPLQMWWVIYPTWGYTEIMAVSALTLWLGFRLLRSDLRRPLLESFLFGLCLGYAFWTSPQTVMISVPVVALLLWKRTLPWKAWLLAAVGSVLSLFPYIFILATRGTAPFLTIVTKPVSGEAQLTSNIHYFFGYTLPVLLFSKASSDITVFSASGVRLLLVLVGLVALTALGFTELAKARHTSSARVPALFPLAIVFFGCLLYVLSGAGSIRGWTARYAAPLFLAVPLAATLLYQRLNIRQAKCLVIAGALILIALQVQEYPILNSKLRQGRIAALNTDKTTVSWLRNNHCELAVGDYWTVYYLNFDGYPYVNAISFNDPEDFYHVASTIKAQGREVRSCLLDADQAHLQGWVKRFGHSGHLEQIAPGLYGYVLDQPIDAAALQQARATGS